MTPRALDWRSVRPKLRKIGELLDTLSGFGTLDGDRLRAEERTALATERILTLVVELAFAVNSHVAVARLQRAPDSYAESFALAAKAGLIAPRSPLDSRRPLRCATCSSTSTWKWTTTGSRMRYR